MKLKFQPSFDPKATPELFDEITRPDIPIHVIKGENQLNPISLTNRKIDKALEKKLTFAKNPTFLVDDNFKNTFKKQKDHQADIENVNV